MLYYKLRAKMAYIIVHQVQVSVLQISGVQRCVQEVQLGKETKKAMIQAVPSRYLYLKSARPDIRLPFQSFLSSSSQG